MLSAWHCFLCLEFPSKDHDRKVCAFVVINFVVQLSKKETCRKQNSNFRVKLKLSQQEVLLFQLCSYPPSCSSICHAVTKKENVVLVEAKQKINKTLSNVKALTQHKSNKLGKA